MQPSGAVTPMKLFVNEHIMKGFIMIAAGLAFYRFERMIDNAFGWPLIVTPIFLILVIRKWVLYSSKKSSFTKFAELQEDNLLSAAKVSEGGTIKESDDVKLKKCAERDSSSFELKKYDEILFRQPESSYLGECPICFIPLSIKCNESAIMYCCCKVVCNGCSRACHKREEEEKLDPKCPFCRSPPPSSERKDEERLKDRVANNDTIAMRELGKKCRDKGHYQSAFQYWLKAAKLGDAGSHNELAYSYFNGRGVERDESRALYHWGQAAIGGHPEARHNLGGVDLIIGRRERAVKHLIIAANLGYDDSLERLKKLYRDGLVNKDDLAAALRGHQAAVDATKSPQREAAGC